MLNREQTADRPAPGAAELGMLADQTEAYGPGAQIRFSSADISLGAVDELPETQCMTLRHARQIDDGLTLEWVFNHISEVNRTLNLSETGKMDKTQLLLLATSILNRMAGLNLIELCVFFSRLREGRYGKFYGRFDSTQFDSWREGFMAELNKEIADYQQAVEPIRKRARDAEHMRMLEKRWAGVTPDTTPIAERIRGHRKFLSSGRRGAEAEPGTPLRADGSVDYSPEARRRTLAEVTRRPQENGNGNDNKN